VKAVSGRGWDVSVNYRAGDDSVSFWPLTANDTLYFWVRTIKQPQYGFQYFSIRIGDYKGNYYKYTGSVGLLNAANLNWKHYQFPLSGNSQFVRSVVGTMTLDSVNYIEFHADTWDFGYTLWVDGVQFSPCNPPITGVSIIPENDHSFLVFPNPAKENVSVRFELSRTGPVRIELTDLNGKLIRTLHDGLTDPGVHERVCSVSNCRPGIYLVRFVSSEKSVTRKIVVMD
jgi:hypothetical protein